MADVSPAGIISRFIRQRPVPGYAPQRMVRSAEQRLMFATDVEAGDEVAWIIDVNENPLPAGICRDTTWTSYGGNAATTVQSESTLITAAGVLFGQEAIFHETAMAGVWQLCFKPANGVWTDIIPTTLHGLNVIPKPEFAPLFGMTGFSQQFIFSGGLNPVISNTMTTGMKTAMVKVPIDGDAITMQLFSCRDGYGTPTGPDSLAKQVISGLSAFTQTLMVNPHVLKVCYATKESGGDSSGDFGELDVVFRQLRMSPERVFRGAHQNILVEGGVAGDKICWTNVMQFGYPSCSAVTDNQTPNWYRTSVHVIGSTNYSIPIHRIDFTDSAPNGASFPNFYTLEVGEYHICYKPSGATLWMPVAGRKLSIITEPTFSPTTGMAAALNPINWFGVVQGDYVALTLDSDANKCNAAHLLTDTSSSLAPQAIGPSSINYYETGAATPIGSILTTTLLDSIGLYYICVATKESIQSQGNSGDDYALISGGSSTFLRYRLVSTPIFTPTRTVFGAPQPILVERTANSDMLLWTIYACNETSGNGTGTTLTPTYTVAGAAGGQTTVTFPDTIIPGLYTFCVNPRGIGTWTEAIGIRLRVIPKPIYSPTAALAGVQTVLSFDTQLVGDSLQHDIVVLTNLACSNAHYGITSSFSQAAQAIGEVYDPQNYPFYFYRITTDAAADGRGKVNVCFATAQSGGDQGGDFSKLDKEFSQLGFSPTRTIQGAPQLLVIEGGLVGDQLAWTKQLSCQQFNVNWPGVHSAEWTNIFTITEPSGNQGFPLHTTADVGQWGLCYKAIGALYFVEIGWTGYKLTIVTAPNFFPSVGMAGSFNNITFTTSANQGDIVVLQTGGCAGAHIVNNTDYTRMGPTVVNSDLKFLTPLFLTTPGAYYICLASGESQGDEETDYAALAMTFDIRERITYHPMRTVQGAPQKLETNGGRSNDLVVWTALTNCNQPLGDASAYKTWTYLLTGVPNQQIDFVTSADPGIWRMCFLPAGGTWTEVAERDLIVIPIPSFWPEIGVAGSITPLLFTRGLGEPSGSQGDVINGDIIVMQEANCIDAHLQVMAEASSPPTIITDYYGYTHQNMTKYSTVLQVCFASKESKGDSQDDYVQLIETIRQVRRALYTPTRIVYGVAQRMHVFDIMFPNFKFKFQQAINCSTEVTDTQMATASFDAIEGSLNYFTMALDYLPGHWKFCYKQEGGI